MLNNRMALALLAALSMLLVVFLIGVAFFRPHVVAGRSAPPTPRWDAAEPQLAPVNVGADLFDGEPLATNAPELSALEPTAMEPTPVDGNVDDLFLTAGEAAPTPAEATDEVFGAAPLQQIESEQPVLYADGAADKSLRNRDFPNTYISHIEVDLTSPHHWVRLTWTGPLADRQETGPFHSSPGAGLGDNNCNDMSESNRDGSNCTPKGEFTVEAFSDYMRTYTSCRFVTWFNVSRAIAFHSYWDVPDYPASHGCVRLNSHAAQLIHNNSLMGKTKVTVGGSWTGR